jgi:hypothetical protein
MQTLRDSGYANLHLDNGLREPLPISRIVAQRGDMATAEILQRFLGVGEARVESTGDLDSDITIQMGEDWVTGLESRR